MPVPSVVFPCLCFINIKSDFVKECFEAALAGFPALHDQHISLRRHPLIQHTMRAQPLMNSGFFSPDQRHYRIDVSNHIEIEAHIRIPDLPREVLVGWFAHELGHVMDYLQRSTWEMARFGVGYLLSSQARRRAEHRADIYATEAGFLDEVLATKRYILEKAQLPDAYLAKIKRYYLSPHALEEIVAAAESGEISEADALLEESQV